MHLNCILVLFLTLSCPRGVILTPGPKNGLYFFCGIFWVLFFSVAEFLFFLCILAPYHGRKPILKKIRGVLSLKIGNFFSFQKIEKWAKKQPKFFLVSFLPLTHRKYFFCLHVFKSLKLKYMHVFEKKWENLISRKSDFWPICESAIFSKPLQANYPKMY